MGLERRRKEEGERRTPAYSYDSILDGLVKKFAKKQQAQFLYWADVKPEIGNMRQEYRKVRKYYEQWNTRNDVCIILAVIVPIVVTILTTQYNLTTLANLIDTVFPACVGVIRKKIENTEEKRHGYLSLIPQYQELLSEVVVDISEETYTVDKEKHYKIRCSELDTDLIRIRNLLPATGLP